MLLAQKSSIYFSPSSNRAGRSMCFSQSRRSYRPRLDIRRVGYLTLRSDAACEASGDGRLLSGALHPIP